MNIQIIESELPVQIPSLGTVHEGDRPERKKFSSELIRKIALEEGADDVGFVEIDRPVLRDEKADILKVYPKTRTMISLVRTMNRENIQSPMRYPANNEFHHTIDDLTEIARRIVARLNQISIRGVVPTVGFPMDMDALGRERIWNVSHKPIAVEAGLGQMGKNRNVIHPKFGNFILLETVLIDADVDRYDGPIEFNPCMTCNLCVSACPVGAIGKDWEFDFTACIDHNYREFFGGFQEWTEAMVTSGSVGENREKFEDRETASMWQSLSFGPNYKAAYCMAVCPAGEEVIPQFTQSKKRFVNEIVRPLKEKEEPVYVKRGSRAETAARKNPAKEIRYVRSMIKPRSVENFLNSVHLIFNPDKAKDADFAIQFRFRGDENIDAVVRIANGKLQVERGIGEGTDLTVRADSAAWLKFVNKETAKIWPILFGKIAFRGNPWHLIKFESFLDLGN